MDIFDKKISEGFCVYANGFKIPFDTNQPKKLIININDISRCSVCNRQIEPKIIKKGIKASIIKDNSENNTLLECDILTIHKRCKKLQDQYKKIEADLINTKWLLFCEQQK